MKKFLWVFLFLSTTHFFAQSISFKITGNVLLKEDKTPIESATVHLEKAKDSTVTTYTITDEKGHFSLVGKSFEKKVKLYISYIGYKSYSKNIEFTGKDISLGTIFLEQDKNTLDEIVITSRAPITIKKDTLEFNVKSFKTKKGANVEDLLKKLPGVEVDASGKITINGKPVNKILVNGKPFFGNDPTITTRNLSKGLIEKVQITNTKTKAEAFTGQKGDDDNKTINLTIKKENNKGWFGKVSAGKGTNRRYEFAAMVNRFNNDTRLSVLIGGNNTNSPGFSFGELDRMSGGRAMSFSISGRGFGGSGITTSKNGGFTYADKLGKKIDINANYFYSSSNSENKSVRNRENILPTRRYFSNSKSSSLNNSNNHNLDLEVDIKIDSTFLININPSFKFNKRDRNSNRFEETLDENKTLINTSTSTNSAISTSNRFSNYIELTKKFGAKGSFLELDIDNIIDNSNGESYNLSNTEIINTAIEIRNQFGKESSKYNHLATTLLYRQPLIGKKLYLDFSYRYANNKRENVKSTYDFDTNTQLYSIFNNQLSTDFTYLDQSKTSTAKIAYIKKKIRLSFKTGYIFRNLKSEDGLRPLLNLERGFEAVEVSTRLRYKFDSKASLYSGYTLRNSAPSLRQLQPFEDISNPLNIITGNPNLKPTDNHRYYLRYHKFNFQKGTGFFGYASFRHTTNNIISKRIIDPTTLIRKTTYENVNGNYTLSLGATYTKKFKIDDVKSIKLRTGLRFSSNKNINFYNNQQYSSKTQALSPNFGFTFDWKNVLEIEPRYSISLSNKQYDLSNFKTQKFTRHSLSINTRTSVPKKLEWRNNIRYTYNPNITGGFQKSAWFWNATLAYSLFKDQGILSLKAYDILNQNTNSRRTATENYIEDSESTVLQQYFMLSFSWKFNTLGKKGESRNGRRRYRRWRH